MFFTKQKLFVLFPVSVVHFLRTLSLIVLCVCILTNIGAMGDPGIICSDSDSWSTNIFTLIISTKAKLFAFFSGYFPSKF